MEKTDSQLIEEYLNGHRVSFDRLVLRYLKLVYAVTLRYVKQQEDAEDLTQDVFVKVMRHLRSFDQGKSFKPWILRIARNVALDWLRVKRPMTAASIESEEDRGMIEMVRDLSPLPDAIASQKEVVSQLVETLHRLPEEDRRLLLLRYKRQLSFREMSIVLHEVIDTVKSRHRRLLMKLRKMLTEPMKTA